jgi:signal transduction histidine kinase
MSRLDDGGRPNVRINWRIAVAGALALSLLFAAQNTGVLGFRQSYLDKLGSQALTWGVWLVFLPAVFAVAARAHARPARDWRRWAFEIGASLAITLLHSIAVGMLHYMLRSSDKFGLVSTVRAFTSLGLPSEFLRYWFIGAVYHALAYHHEVRRRDVTEARMARTLAEARLENLEAKLQPHFLFNALNAIAALIRKDPPAAAAMVGQLSDLLRAALGEAGREVTLAGELQLLNQYVAIQRTRFSDRLSFSVRAQPETLSAYVPQLILQPIVENSVRHGLGARESAGMVDVEAVRHGAMLRLTVRDDGVGFGNAPPAQRGNGIGLRSTRARLTHHYGDAFAFDIRASTPSGTVVTIDVPFHTEGTRSTVTAP